MRKKSVWLASVGLALLVGLVGTAVLLSAPITMAMWQAAGPVRNKQESEASALRSETVQAALTQHDLFDCATYLPDVSPVLPVEQQIFHIVQDIEVTPDDGKEYLGAVWSPNDDAIVFVAPTDGHRDIPDGDTLPSDEKIRLVAVSKNVLMLHFPARDTWQQITSDGARPTWSMNGRSIYYMAGTGLMKFDLDTKTAIHTGLSAPNTGVGLLLSQPLSDGQLLAPRQPHTSLEILGGGMSALSRVGVADSDHIVLSPGGDQMVVAYGANTWQGQFVPAVTVLHHPKGEVTPLLKNCQFSAIEMVWSPTGSQIAYPVHAERSEIRICDVRSGQTRVLVRLETNELLSGLSWSSDGKYLAFTQADDRSTPRSIWVVSTDGMVRQRLVEGGLLPNWSPDGRYILYARPGTDRLLDWYLLQVLHSAVNAKGE
jgi:WD40 repeat protein